MLMKNALAALLGLTLAAEAASVHHYRSPVDGGLVRRQNKNNGGNRFGGNRGGGGGGNQNGQNGGQNGGQNNNQNQNQGGQNQGGQNNQNQGGNQGGNNDQASVTCLAANAVQTGSQQTGQNGQVADGQVEAAVDPANFINFCAGKDLTNGFQKRGGSCNGIVMGDIPSVENMVSTVILEPGNFQDLAVGQTFTIRLNVANLNLGAFTNATSTYYSSPAQLGGNGRIIGHTHVTVQDTGNSLNPQTPLDAKQFVFFKGINDAGNGQGLVQTDVTGGLPAGNYRVCTMSSAANHQPVLMPVAQRGSQEDCKYFTVGQGNGQQNGGAQNQNGQNGGAQNQNGGAQNQNGQNGGAQNQNGQNGGAQNQNGQNGGAQNQNGQNGGGAQNQNGQNGGAQNQNGQNGGAQNQNGQNGGGAQNQNGQNGGGAQNQNGQNGGAQNQNGQNGGGNQQQNNGGQGKGKGGGGRGGQQANNNGGGANGGAQNNAGGGGGGAIGGVAAPAVEDSGDASRPFKVGDATFVNREAAVQRACAIQNNACSDGVNRGQIQGSSLQACNAQEQACRNAA